MESLMVVKRNGTVVSYDPIRIENAIAKAIEASENKLEDNIFEQLVEDINEEIRHRFIDLYPNVENIQDIVEKHLMRQQLFEVAKVYIIYRAQRQTARQEHSEETLQRARLGKLKVHKRNGRMMMFDSERTLHTWQRVCKGLEHDVSREQLQQDLLHNIFDGISTADLEKAMCLSATSFIERDPAYNVVAARLFLQRLYKEVLGFSSTDENLNDAYCYAFINGIRQGVQAELLDPKMLNFNLDELSKALIIDNDRLFGQIGLQTLHERYFLKIGNQRLELPQSFWMRVAMGLALEEDNPTERAIEFYSVMSELRFVPSTPTLFHSGSCRPQLSSCYLTTINDDLGHIFKCLGDNAQYSKWSGGLGNDWTPVRSTGAFIHTTGVESQGVVPFLKIANDVTMAINRSGKRRGATCAYLETWHLDIEDFLDLRRNTGDERRRTHDMNTSNWIPDLFMKRVEAGAHWTLFSPDETPDLHEIYGSEFEQRYCWYEQEAEAGRIKKHKRIEAKALWRKMLTRLFETGHPWITFKDPCNVRSPQDHVGVVHSSNLCTEITLNTSAQETAVCNLGSLNISRHIGEESFDRDKLADTISIAMRMLDNVIDLNFYPAEEARNSNLLHRPVGLGMMGLQDTLFELKISFEQPEVIEFCDSLMEWISYHAILSSSVLAKERGKYQTCDGSKWDRGILPFDTVGLLEEERGVPIEVSRNERLDWGLVREHIQKWGMRNSNTMAIAPTATIATIAGCFPSIEPIYKNIYVKSNISGEFTIVNKHLVTDLKQLNLWDKDMLEQIKSHDGNLNEIERIPDDIKLLYREAFQIDPVQLIALTAERGKWIDQSQSHNVFMQGTSGKMLDKIYTAAWRKGLKTTYYLRTLAASQIEKSTLDASKYGFTQKRSLYNEQTAAVETSSNESNDSETVPQPIETQVTSFCSLNDPDCESCQ